MEAKQEQTLLVQLDEVDLGEFRISLPASGGARTAVVEFHAFGQITARDRADVVAALKSHEPEFRNRVLMFVRTMSPSDFNDAELSKLRSELTLLANAQLERKAVTNVGFYSFHAPTLH